MYKPSEKLISEIQNTGVVSFSRFMELALYCPDGGYYEREEDKIGKTGDFITSVSVGTLFGRLLAARFADWLEEPGCGSNTAKIAEAGAHNAALSRDVLEWLSLCRPDIFSRVEYWMIEPSCRRREWQRRRLHEFAPKARWVSDISELRSEHPAGFEGVVFANEFLDALPLQRFQWDAARGAWFELGVGFDEGCFVWHRMPGPVAVENHPLLRRLPVELFSVLPDGFTTEFCSAAIEWWATASRLLRKGKLVTIDYGLTTEELFVPHRCEGTLRAYRSHHHSPDVLADPGEQDITAHVNFSLLQETGEKAGLRTEGSFTQAQFLVGIAQRVWTTESWNEQQKAQFKALTDPGGLGRFRVLIQDPWSVDNS